MVAIAALLAVGIFEHNLGMLTFGMDQALINAILSGAEEDVFGLRGYLLGYQITWYGGLTLLWVAAILTAITGFDYLRKAWVYLQD